MAEEVEVGCARPTGGPVGEPVEETAEEKSKPVEKEISMIHVGEKVPDFVARDTNKGNSSTLNCPTTWGSGPCSVFTRVISPLSERPSSRRSP